ncbi:hypothetical protein K7432_008964 [Basidiobolus ranarum]|uniref:Uncharacterized protein n=1 Tax=Basidiobolus ranarum TaxID=34480 RepID=A0ABR2WQZ8_9FUNG
MSIEFSSLHHTTLNGIPHPSSAIERTFSAYTTPENTVLSRPTSSLSRMTKVSPTNKVMEPMKRDASTRNQDYIYMPHRTGVEEGKDEVTLPVLNTQKIYVLESRISVDSTKTQYEENLTSVLCTKSNDVKVPHVSFDTPGYHYKRDVDETGFTRNEQGNSNSERSEPRLSTPTSSKAGVRSEFVTILTSPKVESTIQTRPGISSTGPQATEGYPIIYTTTTQLEAQSSLVSFYRSREAARENLMDILIGSLIGISAAFFITLSLLIYLSIWMWRKSQQNLSQQDSYLNFFRTDPRMFMDTSPSINKSVTTEDPYYNQTIYSETGMEDLEQREVDSVNNLGVKYNSSSNEAISRPPSSFVRSTSWFMHRLSPTSMPHVAFVSPRRGPLVSSALRVSTASLRPSEASGSFIFDPANGTIYGTPVPPPAPWTRPHSQSIEILPANPNLLNSPSERGIKSSCF